MEHIDPAEFIEFKHQYLSGFRGLLAIIAASEHDLFTKLNSEFGRSVGELADSEGLDARGLAILLDSLVQYGLVAREGECAPEEARERSDVRYRLAERPILKAVLTSDSCDSLLPYIAHMKRLTARWLNLAEAIKAGHAPRRPPKTPEMQRTFTLAMRGASDGLTDATAKAVEPLIRNAKTLLDVGCGPGTYAQAFLKISPEIRIRLFDHSEVLDLACECIEESAPGALEQITFCSGDLFHCELPKENDIVFSSNLIHAFKTDALKTALKKLTGAVRKGGYLITKDFLILDEAPKYLKIEDVPGFDNNLAETHARFFSLNMLSADAGRSYSRAEIARILHEAGLTELTWMPLVARGGSGDVSTTSSMIIARKP
ncbi:methyltransferase domain-containing protein [bacterium]|nr:methyltransferase domain-containing protein [bacterium]